MEYNKLVRDKIPEIIKNKEKIPIIHIANDKEYWVKLKEKLQEEVDEFLEEDNIEELADILEVIYDIKDFKFQEKDLEEIRKYKKDGRGGFKDKIILEKVKDPK